MTKAYFLVFLTFDMSACGNSSGTGTDDNNPNKPAASKHIEAGTNLTLACSDTFNDTTVVLSSVWNQTMQAWDITAEEINRSGQTINEQRNLIGTPDPVQDWQMNIRNGAQHFAKVAQNGANQAMFYGSRNMQCVFH